MIHVVARLSRSLAGVESAASPAHLGPAGGSAYARWLEELVRRFGAGAVGRWRQVPSGWDFEELEVPNQIQKPDRKARKSLSCRSLQTRTTFAMVCNGQRYCASIRGGRVAVGTWSLTRRP